MISNPSLSGRYVPVYCGDGGIDVKSRQIKGENAQKTSTKVYIIEVTMNKYFEINRRGHNVRCKLYANEFNSVKKIILFCHGFAGHKDNGTAEKYADMILPRNEAAALLIFNWPAHGDDVNDRIKLSDCMDYLDIVLNYIKETYNNAEIYSCATSFGGYLTLSYISRYGSPFKKIALRCPAVNMYNVLTETIMSPEEVSKVQNEGTASVGFDRKINVDAQFLKDLQDGDIQKNNYLDYSPNTIIVHGTADEVVPFETCKRFAEKNNIEFIPVEGADHRFQDPVCGNFAAEKVVEFLGF